MAADEGLVPSARMRLRVFAALTEHSQRGAVASPCPCVPSMQECVA